MEKEPSADSVKSEENKVNKPVEEVNHTELASRDAPVIEKLASQSTKLNDNRTNEDVISAEAIDVINNNKGSKKKETDSETLVKSENAEINAERPVENDQRIETVRENETVKKEKAEDQEATGEHSDSSESGGEQESSRDKAQMVNKRNEVAAAAAAAAAAVAAARRECDGMSAAASEEDNAISGTDSGGIVTPVQRRHSEIHLSEPAMLKEAIESSWKEVLVLSSAGSDSETQEELGAALRRRLHQRQVSETLISEIEEIIKEKFLDGIINDEVSALSEHAENLEPSSAADEPGHDEAKDIEDVADATAAGNHSDPAPCENREENEEKCEKPVETLESNITTEEQEVQTAVIAEDVDHPNESQEASNTDDVGAENTEEVRPAEKAYWSTEEKGKGDQYAISVDTSE